MRISIAEICWIIIAAVLVIALIWGWNLSA